MGVHARAGMQKVVTPDDLRIGIGEKCIRVAGLAAQIGGLFRRVHAGGHRPNSQIFESRQLLFQYPVTRSCRKVTSSRGRKSRAPLE